MVRHIFPNFLQDVGVYAQTERFWIELWNKVSLQDVEEMGWEQPWFKPLPPDVSEGNPIFSAVSSKLRRGIRILQSEPTESGLEFFAYPDTFGGTIFDPSAIHELVISCALSDVAESLAFSMMSLWVVGKSLSFDLESAGQVPISRRPPDWSFDRIPLLPAA